MRTAVGLSIRGGAVTCAFLKAKKKVLVDNLVTVPLKGSSLGETLRDIWQRYELAGQSTVACLSAKDCILRQLVVPFLQEEKIRKVIRFEAENYLHASAIEDVVVDFLKVDEIGTKSSLLLVAARKDTVSRLLRDLEEGGVDPEIVDLDCVALYNAWALTDQYTEKGNVVLLDVGPQEVRLAFVQDGSLKKIRSFRLYTDSHLLEETNRLLSPPEADRTEEEAQDQELSQLEEKFSELEGEFGDEEPIALLEEEELALLREASEEEENRWAPIFERVVAEAQRTFASELFGSVLDSVYITGPGALVSSALARLEEAFEAPVKPLDLSCLFEKEAPSFEEIHRGDSAVAIGLGARGLELARAGLDFRREEFRYEKRFAKLRVPLLFTGLLLFAFLFFNCIYLRLEEVRHLQEYQNIRAAQEVLYQATFGETPPKNVNLVALVKQKWKSLKGLVGEGGAGMPHFVPVLDLLEDVGSSVKKAGIAGLIWRKIDLRTEIAKPAVSLSRRTPEIKAGTLAVLLPPGDPTLLDRIRSAIDENSKYVKVSTYTPSTDRPTGKTLGRITIVYKESYVEKVLKLSGTKAPEAKTASTSLYSLPGGSYAKR